MKIGDQVVCRKKYDDFYSKKGIIIHIDYSYPYPVTIEFQNIIEDAVEWVSYKKRDLISIESLKLKKLLNKEL